MGNAVQPSLRGGTAEPTGSCTGELSQAAFLTVHIDPSKSMRAYLDDSFLVLLLICEFGAFNSTVSNPRLITNLWKL